MDSQLISILIGIAFVVGAPLLEKVADKLKHRVSSPGDIVRRQESAPGRKVTPKASGKIVSAKPVEIPVEGERVTADTPTIRYEVEPEIPAITRDELRKAMIWSEILNNPKFKDN